MEDRLNELPKGWARSSLGEVCIRITKGSTPTSYGYTYKKEGIKFIKAENIDENGSIAEISDFIDGETNLFLKRSILEPNDILFSIAGTIGRVGYIQEKDLPANTNQALAIVRCPWNFISNKYFFHFLKSPFIQNRALNSIVGVGRANISLTDISEFAIPLPPLPEQQRIVAKIEELFTKLDAGIEALKKIKAQLKRYRQAVLKYAFEGKLTEEWRKNVGAYGNPPIEPASVLLEKIKEERKKDAKGKFKELPPVDTSEMPELPEGWVWATIEHIVSDSLIGLVRSAYEQNSSGVGFPYIKMNNITMDGKVLLDDLVYIDATDEELEKYNIKEGDILFNTRNSLQLVGKTGIVRGITKNILYNNNLMRIRTFNGVSPTFLAYQVCSIDFRKRMEKVKRATTNVAAIYAKDLMPLFFILPPYIEQLKIIEAIESRLSVADELEKVVEQTLKQSERLRRSVLKKAFEGKLVCQDPTDESAEKLLERIKEERAKQEKVSREKRTLSAHYRKEKIVKIRKI